MLLVAVLGLVSVAQAGIGPVNETEINRPKIPDIHTKPFTLFSNVSAACNFFTEQELVRAPWPQNCQVYQHTDGCKKYEISRDGKKVNSCELKYGCQYELVESRCLEYFPAENTEATRFPDTGQQCFFKESLYPLLPWPNGCKIFQANDVCDTYEISDEGNFVMSCDLTLDKGVCIKNNTKPMECIEYCPDGSCINKDWAKFLTVSLMSVAAVVVSTIA